MTYPTIPAFANRIRKLELYAQLYHEYGSPGIDKILARSERELDCVTKELTRLPMDPKLIQREPNQLSAIRKLRPTGPRCLWTEFDPLQYQNRLSGAMMSRMAGNILGAIVECWSIEDMEDWAEQIGDKFPPIDYWSRAKDPDTVRYLTNRRREYTRRGIDGVPVDDDLAYTWLGLLIVERFGAAFTTDDVAKAWLEYLPIACTAEAVALRNLRHGISPKKAAERDNPYCQWIGAAIRADPWGYLAPGWPERAAEMAYRDAYLSHRRNGVYGDMFFAAAIAAAFAVDDPIEAIQIGLTEIPRECSLARDVRWALRTRSNIRNYADARKAVDRRFKGMAIVHTNNNACLTIFGLSIGKRDVTKVISQTVAMGLDNDCTAATAGSMVGAVVGHSDVPKHWYRRFNNHAHSYLLGKPLFRIDDLIKRFTRQARLVHVTD